MRGTEPLDTGRRHGADARGHVPAAHRPRQGDDASRVETTSPLDELVRGLGVVAAGLWNRTVSRRSGLRLAPPAGGIVLVVVRRGDARLLHDAVVPRQLTAGDAVVATGGRPFVLAHGSADPERPGPFQDLPLDRHGEGAPVAFDVDAPTAELTTAFYAPAGGPAGTSRLPEVLVRPGVCGAGSGVEVLDVGAHEDRLPDVLVSRLLDWLLPCHLAGWLEDDAGAVDRLVATDDIVGPALRALHEAPHEPWTVSVLAASVGVSRSTFMRRFREHVGEPPMRYLAGRRLALAAEHLRDSSAQLDTIAHRVGYADGFALSRAFSRTYGVSPSTYRASGRSSPSAVVRWQRGPAADVSR